MNSQTNKSSQASRNTSANKAFAMMYGSMRSTGKSQIMRPYYYQYAPEKLIYFEVTKAGPVYTDVDPLLLDKYWEVQVWNGVATIYYNRTNGRTRKIKRFLMQIHNVPAALKAQLVLLNIHLNPETLPLQSLGETPS